jgi:probable phosphoglycerate mutase
LILLVRHGATEWSDDGRHTGRTDLPLTEKGRHQADRLPPLLATLSEGAMPLVFTSPLQRAWRLLIERFPASRRRSRMR